MKRLIHLVPIYKKSRNPTEKRVNNHRGYQKGNRWFIDYCLLDGGRKGKVVGHVDKITRSLAEKALKVRVEEIVQGKSNLEKS